MIIKHAVVCDVQF